VLLSIAGVAFAQTPVSSTSGPPFTVSAEALLWWFKGNATPPLISDGYVSDVVRAPQQMSRTVNDSSFNLPPGPPDGPQVPTFKFTSTDFWAQGLNLGLALRF